MELESYFTVLDRDDIRVKGTWVGIETILDDYLNGTSPEEIAARYRSLSLEQVYATITYYLHNRPTVDAYLAVGAPTATRAGRNGNATRPRSCKRCAAACSKQRHRWWPRRGRIIWLAAGNEPTAILV